jgi:prepilin-type N-terminal cleavage/methylation domain-containing protein
MKNKKSGYTLVEIMIVLVIIGLVVAIAMPLIASIVHGVGSLGPTRRQIVTVESAHVDVKEGGSHYMVGTDAGVFELENGFFLGIYNADELYAKLKKGGRYAITTKGNKAIGFWMQEYPYIVSIEEMPSSK